MRLLALVGVSLALLVTLFFVAERQRQQGPDHVRIGAERMLAIRFAHKDHHSVRCTDCHHEFSDGSGPGQCFDCHLRQPELRAVLETQFHDLCRGCHLERVSAGEAAGPLRDCADCHRHDEEP